MVIALSLTAWILQKISLEGALGISIGAALVLGLVIWLKNYKNSAYGENFHQRYPDSHN